MYENHPNCLEPEPDNKLWRYMSFSKFVSLLDTKSLFFAEPSALGDKFEGSYPKNNNQIKMRPLTKEEFENNNYQYNDNYEEYLKNYNLNKQFMHNSFNICCFHLNEHESFAFWKIYSSEDYGIAIQTTFENLKKSLVVCEDKNVSCGKIIYLDYSDKSNDIIDPSNVYAPYLCKRKCFEYENECRAIFWDLPHYVDIIEKNEDNKNLKDPICISINSEEKNKMLEKNNGIYIPVDLNSLISNVYCSPDSPKLFVDLVKSIIKKYNFIFNVIKSSLDDEPNF